jgi:hypothetical protein
LFAELGAWWLNDAYCTWYEGFLVGMPSTSNNIESFHQTGLKAKSKLVQRLPTVQFLNTMEKQTRPKTKNEISPH